MTETVAAATRISAPQLEAFIARAFEAVSVPRGDAGIIAELMTRADSPVAKFLERNPRGGIHHFSLNVDNVAAAVDTVKARGVRVLGGGGQKNVHGERIAFVHPRDFLGALVELEEHSTLRVDR